MISDEFDRQYTEQYYNSPPPGKALGKPDAPRGIKHWGLRTLWCFWIDRHLALVEQVQGAFHTSAKSKIQEYKSQDAKDFVGQTMTSGAAAVSKFKFPQKNPGNPLPGDPLSASNEKSRYGMWGDNELRKLGL